MILKGLRFGMLLQFAIGPMCFMVFNTSATHGFATSLSLVLAIALVDALYIALSCVGVVSVINRPEVKTAVKWAGGLVLVLFGINTTLGAFGLSILPNITLFSQVSGQNLFVQGLLLTASNPLTILFWGGVLSAQIIENHWDKKQLFFFASGCVMATVLFLSAVALLGGVLGGFLSPVVVRALNTAVGIILVFFGVKLLLKKEQQAAGG